MKNSHCRDPKMEAYCDEVRRLEDKFYGLDFNHIARRYNETADELAKIASGRTTVPSDIFSRDPHQPSVKIDDMGSRLIKTGRPRTCNTSTEESCPSTEPKLGGWRDAPSRSSCWEMGRSSTTAAPQVSSSDAFPSPKVKNSYERYTRGLAAITRHLEPLSETPSGKVSTG
jgi:hypothetical protein